MDLSAYEDIPVCIDPARPAPLDPARRVVLGDHGRPPHPVSPPELHAVDRARPTPAALPERFEPRLLPLGGDADDGVDDLDRIRPRESEVAAVRLVKIRSERDPQFVRLTPVPGFDEALGAPLH